MPVVIAYGQARIAAHAAERESLATLRAESLARIAAASVERRRELRRARRREAIAESRRPYMVAAGDPRCWKLHQVSIWQCPICQRQWHWPRRPTACGFCPKE